jgi:Fe-S-cluster-containing dehydrogenase component
MPKAGTEVLEMVKKTSDEWEGGMAKELKVVDKGNESSEVSRRQFLWKGMQTFAWGTMSLTCIPMVLRAEADKRAGVKTKKEVLYGFLIDTTKCIGCGKCVLADKIENGVPEHQFRTWVERYVYNTDSTLRVDANTKPPYSFSDQPGAKTKEVAKAFFVPKLCNHCTNTPCIQVCPVGASYRTEEGVVLIDDETCIGCGYCVQACPFDTRFIHAERHVADKCTWCYHRIKKGQQPACVEACPTKTRVFGNIADPESEISRLLAKRRTDVLKSYLGTQPNTRYIGLTSEVI